MRSLYSLVLVLVEFFLLELVPIDCCRCSPEIQQELSQLKERIYYLESSLQRNCQKCSENYCLVGERCYRVFLDRKPWTEAHENCTVDGAELVSLQTQEEETLLRDYLNATFAHVPFRLRFYTAGNEVEQKGEWKWGVGKGSEELEDYINWAPGEPNDHLGESEQCLEMHLGEGWFDVPCYLDFMWICERNPGNYPVLERQSAVENVWRNGDQPVNFRRPYKPFWIQAIYDTYRNLNADGQTREEEEEEEEDKEPNSDQTDEQMEVTNESSGNVGDGGAKGGTDAENTTNGEVVTTGNNGDPDITTQSFMVTTEN